MTFEINPHEPLLCKCDNYGLSPGYLNWFAVTQQPDSLSVHIYGVQCSPFVTLSGVPQMSVLKPVLSNFCIND